MASKVFSLKTIFDLTNMTKHNKRPPSVEGMTIVRIFNENNYSLALEYVGRQRALKSFIRELWYFTEGDKEYIYITEKPRPKIPGSENLRVSKWQ